MKAIILTPTMFIEQDKLIHYSHPIKIDRPTAYKINKERIFTIPLCEGFTIDAIINHTSIKNNKNQRKCN